MSGSQQPDRSAEHAGRCRRSRSGPARGAGRRVRLRRRRAASSSASPSRGARRAGSGSARAVGGDRLQRDEAVARGPAATPAASPPRDPRQRLDPAPAGGGRPARPSAASRTPTGRREAVVDEQPLGAAWRAAAWRRTRPDRRAATLEDGPRLLAPEQRRARRSRGGRRRRSRRAATAADPCSPRTAAELVERRDGAAGRRARGGRRARPRSVLREVALLLECLVLRRVRLPLRPPHREVGPASIGPSASIRTRRPRARPAPPPASPAAGGCRALALVVGSVAGSTSTGSGSFEPALEPVEPAAISPPSARYGLQLASAALSSTFVDASSMPRKTDGKPQRRLAVVVPPARERARPRLRRDAGVRVEARRGEPAQAGQVLEHAGEERAPSAEKWGAGVVEAVAPPLAVPEREVDVAAVAGGVRPRLRRERGDEPMARGDAADRLAHHELLVGGLQRRAVGRRQLLLAVPELGVVLLERGCPAPRGPRRGRRRSPATRSCRWSRSRGSSRPARTRRRRLVASENSFSNATSSTRRARPAAPPSASGTPAGQTGAGVAVERSWSTSMAPVGGAYGRTRNVSGIGDEADLADRPHPLHRLQLVERVHRLHREAGHS